MHDNFMKSGDAGEPTAVFFKFLHVAFAVSGADDKRVIPHCIRRPFSFPKLPREIATDVISLGVAPALAVIETELDAGNPAVASICNALDFDGRT